LGQAHGDEQEVIAGVSNGEQVVTRGLGELRDGQHVQLKR
jgi:hypothetical protein